MKEIILYWAFRYIRTSICIGTIFVIITSIRNTMDYEDWKDRLFVGLIMAGIWPWILIKYLTVEPIHDFIKKKGGAKNDK